MRGFSLFEVILYLALTSLLLTGFFVSAAFLHDAALRSKRDATDLLTSLNALDGKDVGTHEL